MKVKLLLIEVWLSLPHPVTGDLRGSVGRLSVQMWILPLVRLRQRRREGEVETGGRGGDGGGGIGVFPPFACVWCWR